MTGFALLERDDASTSGPRLLGYGESSGARMAAEIDYINLHGTASLKNDEMIQPNTLLVGVVLPIVRAPTRELTVL